MHERSRAQEEIMTVKKEIGTIYTMWLGEMLRFWRSKSRIIGAVLAPLAFIIFLAPGFTSGFKFREGGDIDISFFVPGLICVSVAMISMFSSTSIIWEKEFGILKSVLITPVSRFSIVLGKAVGGVTIALVQGILVMIFMIFAGVNYVSISGMAAGVLVLLISGIGFVGLGIALASKFDSQEGFQMTMGFLTTPIAMMSGAFFPISDLPTWLRSIVYLNPLTYSVDAIRWSLLGSSTISIWLSFEVMIFFAIAMVGIAGKLFGKMSI